MKTKIKKYSSMYGIVAYISPVLVVLIGIIVCYKSQSFVLALSCIIVGVVVAFYLQIKYKKRLKSKIKDQLLLDFEEFLRSQVAQGEWIYTLPSNTIISEWCYSYIDSLDPISLAADIWKTTYESNENHEEKWKDVLKRVYVPCFGSPEEGISLYDIFFCDTIDPKNVEKKSTNTLNDMFKTRVFLRLMPVEDLLENLGHVISMQQEFIYCVASRQKSAGDFTEFCNQLISKKKELVVPMESVVLLLDEGKFPVPIVFPQKFMAYIIKQEAENTLNLRANPEKRKRVLVWWLNRQKKEWDFLKYWPSFLVEEIEIIKGILSPKQAAKVFELKEVWSELSDSKMRGLFIRYIEYPEKFKDRSGFLYEYHKRF